MDWLYSHRVGCWILLDLGSILPRWLIPTMRWKPWKLKPGFPKTMTFQTSKIIIFRFDTKLQLVPFKHLWTLIAILCPKWTTSSSPFIEVTASSSIRGIVPITFGPGICSNLRIPSKALVGSTLKRMTTGGYRARAAIPQDVERTGQIGTERRK